LSKPQIIIYPHGQFENGFLIELSDEISHALNCQVFIQTLTIDLEAYYDHSRRQYDGNKLLKEIEGLTHDEIVKKIGLFQVDLYIPILTFIFGQAIFNGNSGIASLYRLKNEQYGLKPDQQLLLNRFKKVIIHELGHTFGLIHCHVPNCVMRSGTYVEDIDQKTAHFCSHCRMVIDKAMQ